LALNAQTRQIELSLADAMHQIDSAIVIAAFLIP